MAVNNEYVNRVDANGQTLIDLTNDTATAGDVLAGRTLHLASGAPATGTYRPSDEIEARLEATVGHSNKNLLPITLESRPYDTDGNDFRVTVDKVGGTITINGTSKSSGATNIDFYTDTNGKLSGNFYITGGVTGCVVRAYDYDSQDANKWAKKWDGTTTASGSSSEHDSQEVQAVAGHKFGYRLRVAAGQSFTNAVIKPMLRDGSISDDTFEPYVTPTDEKKQDKPVVLWEATTKSEMTEQVTFPTTEIENIGYFIVFAEVRSELQISPDVVTFIVYNGMFFGELSSYYNISTMLTFGIEEGTAAISVVTTDVDAHEPKIIKIVGIPK